MASNRVRGSNLAGGGFGAECVGGGGGVVVVTFLFLGLVLLVLAVMVEVVLDGALTVRSGVRP